MNVAQRLTFLREKKGITTNKLANLAGISQSHLREIEMGKRSPTVETLSYFCDALGIDLAEFFSDDMRLNPFLATALKQISDEQQQTLAVFLKTMTK
ncbi:MAG: helix-turn-helix domain-containing protein [Oscillospiraceae bacterium]|nr:helix-turn-helix domain-containing protein [Oscillospiraceae bacterium]